MANDDLGCLGFIFKLVFPVVVIFVVAGMMDMCSSSQSSMIKEARRDENIRSYNSYLKTHPNGKYVEEAKAAILKLAKASSADDVDLLDATIEKNYDEMFSEELSAIRDSIVDAAYAEARRTDGWSLYMYLLPEAHWRDAEKQQEMAEKRNWGTEGSAWKSASESQSQAGYTKYLELYPKGRHAKQAVDWLVNNVYQGSYGSLPLMERTRYSQSARSTIRVFNRTQYKLTVLYSGKDSKGLVLQPGTGGEVTLPNGSYRVAASVSAGNVRSFAGSESLTGGSYEVTYYIETRQY